MKKVKTTVNYKVPEWEFCNCSRFGKPTSEKCRFCVKQGKGYACTLHNMPLDVVEGILIKKDKACIRATAGFPSEVVDTEQVDPKLVMKLALQEYRKLYKKFIRDGYPDSMADKLAAQLTIGGK